MYICCDWKILGNVGFYSREIERTAIDDELKQFVAGMFISLRD